MTKFKKGQGLFILFVLGLLFSLYFFWTNRLGPHLFTNSQLSTMTSFLSEQQEAFLELSYYRTSLLFPYDYIDHTREVDWRKYEKTYNKNRNLDSYLLQSNFSWEEHNQFLYDFCRYYGFSLDRQKMKFTRFTATVRGGIDLSQIKTDMISIQNNVLFVSLPKPVISDIIIEDRKSIDPFPGLPLSPDQWALLISYSSKYIKYKAESTGFLEQIEEEASLFFHSFLQAAGYKDIRVSFY